MEEIHGYQIGKQIGEGGMATVFMGVQVSLDRPVAIKILSKKMVANSSILERFKRESLIIAKLSHPNIIHVIDRGVTKNGMPFFVMEYVEGTDLEKTIKSNHLDINRKLDLTIQICKALSYAHKNGVIHRDIKPANVLIDKEGVAKVLDFGIAQFFNADHGGFEHTTPGTIMGTLAYMSPEQQNSSDTVTMLSDLYSLGVMMYELFTGVKPVGRFQLPSEVDPGFPLPLQEIIMACLEKEPTDRPSSADEIKDTLLKLLRGAHLKTDQKERASLGITNIKERFALLDIIREAPQGSVYLYENKSNKELMVIKRAPSTSSGFMEAKLLTSLRHKNVAKILGTSKNEKFFIIVMEYLSGGSLKDRLIQTHSREVFLTKAKQICEGLNFAHKNRIIHGNLRPSNILFTETGDIKITDFGLDEHYASRGDETNWFNVGSEPKSVCGDILALGIIFYQMLTGTLPVWGNNMFTPSDAFRKLTPKIQSLIAKMISPNLDRRYQNLDDVIKDVSAITVSGLNTIIESPFRAAPALTDKKPLEGQSSSASGRLKRIAAIKTALLLFLLILAAIVYLIHAGKIDVCIDSLMNLCRKIFQYGSSSFRQIIAMFKQ